MGKRVRVAHAPTLADVDVQAATDAIPHMVWIADGDGAVTYFNQATAAYTGLAFNQLVGEGWLQAVHPEDVARVRAAWHHSVRVRVPYAAEYRLRDLHGRYRRVQDRANPAALSRPEIRWIGTVTDVEDDRRLRDQLAEAEWRATRELAVADALAASAPIASGLIDTEFRLVRINDTLARLNGLSSDDDLGRPVAEVIPELWPIFEPRYRHVLTSGESLTVIETVPHAEDRRPTTWLTTYFPVLLDGEVSGVGIVGADITEAKQAERFRTVVMDTMAEGLYALDAEGRVSFLNRSASEMLGWTEDEVRGRRAHDLIHYLHRDGSAYPEENCPVLKVRTDCRTLRVADDAFIRKDGTLLPVCYSASPLQDDTGAVAGVVVVFRDAAVDAEQRQRVQQELEALAWLGRVRDALEDDRLCLYTQPIIPLTGGTPSEELLVRLITTTGEVIPPGMFLPVAERYGLVADVDRWVLRRAIERAAAGYRVEVNVSAWTIAHDDLIPLIDRLLTETGADPANLVIEITETALMQDLAAGREFADGLKALGCGLALDDFGTGYASFTYLKSMPLTYLKIDVEFVRDLAESEANRHVVDAIVSLAKGFGYQTIAEGVEDERTLTILRQRGVDYAQGFHIGPPAPPADRARARPLGLRALDS
jgi:PAS domain S-box-containing protein